MTGEQMEENFGITDYSFINASPADSADAKIVSNQLLQVIRDVPKAVLQDYTTAIATQKGYLGQQQIFFSSIAVILLIISLFHIVNSMSHTILTRRREYGIIRAIGITDGGFYKMILQTGILYGLLADVFIYLIYNRVLRRVMNYYLAHVAHAQSKAFAHPEGRYLIHIQLRRKYTCHRLEAVVALPVQLYCFLLFLRHDDTVLSLVSKIRNMFRNIALRPRPPRKQAFGFV